MVEDLGAAAPSQEFRVTPDGFGPHIRAFENMLPDRANFVQLDKVYRPNPKGEHRYSPAGVVSTEVVPALGKPIPSRICTSIVDRQNLTMRMQIRRLTRLMNAFSKKRENLWAALYLHSAFCNLCRIHGSLRVTPAMEAGIGDDVREISELLA